MKWISTRTLRRRWKNMVRRIVFHSYSQYGEDLIIDAILGIDRPFYVDIGANHPKHLSNTYRFYRRGGTGINVEPDPSAFPDLATARPSDINLPIGISVTSGTLPFYRISASTLSTFNKSDADLSVADGYRLLQTVQVPIETLAVILERHRPKGAIDFISIDVEGYEIEILKSNDWSRFRPTVIVLEINRNQTSLLEYMGQLDYVLVMNNGTNGIFLDRKARQPLLCTPKD